MGLYTPDIRSASTLWFAVQNGRQDDSDYQSRYMGGVIHAGAGKAKVQGKGRHGHKLPGSLTHQN